MDQIKRELSNADIVGIVDDLMMAEGNRKISSIMGNNELSSKEKKRKIMDVMGEMAKFKIFANSLEPSDTKVEVILEDKQKMSRRIDGPIILKPQGIQKDS
ncbi:MAG: hypothetical protein FWE16_04940 [Firmicutes bacterium]|nr:hypothetical protein [Bacillota bacterium]